jgi:hypothetical protein
MFISAGVGAARQTNISTNYITKYGKLKTKLCGLSP